MSDEKLVKAVVMARGLGTRMRRRGAASLTTSQAAAAEAGLKAMMPIGRPFLDYVLSVLADAGIERVCLVIGPEHDSVREYYGRLTCQRLTIEFAVQAEPRGTADAVAAAAEFAGDDPFICINGDTYYPRETFEALRAMDGPGLAVFAPADLISGGNIAPERVKRFAIVQVDARRRLRGIVEKPDEVDLGPTASGVGVSVNAWRFDKRIFEACRAIGPSPRGEYEIPDAVTYLIDRAEPPVCFQTAMIHAGVLDLSCRDDVVEVARRLSDVEVDL